MGQRPQVAYLGLDAFDVGVAASLIERGELPTLQRLLSEGASIETEAPAGVFVSAQWPTLFTGRDPARHQYFCWAQLMPGTYEDRLTTPHLIDGTPLWETLSDAGKRVAIMDVPHTWVPDRELNGVMISEWGCHDRHFGTQSFPPSLVRDINDHFGPHPIGCQQPPSPGFDQFAPCDYIHRAGSHRTPDEVVALWGDILRGHERKRAASLHLLDQGPWDLFMAVFGESHCTGHQLWAVHDSTHPWHEADVRARLGVDPLVAIYRRIDETLAAHLDRLGPDTLVYVNLSHGMGPHFDGTHLLDDVLRRLATADRGGLRSSARSVASNTVALAHRMGGARASAALRRVLARPAGTAPDLGQNPDPVGGDRGGRPWFAVPNNTVSGGIRLNIIGREPRGVLAAGADVEAAYDRLHRGLLELLNADTGEPVVTDVVRTDSIYARSHGDALPDLFVEWNRSAPIERVWSPRIGLVERQASHWRTGDHTTDGLLIAAGPGIEPGRRPGRLPVVDIGVTLAAAVGVPLPDVDGRPVDFLLPPPEDETEAAEGVGEIVPVAVSPTLTPASTSASASRAALVQAPLRRARAAQRQRIVRRDALSDRLTSHVQHLAGRLDMLGDAHHVTRAQAENALQAAHHALHQAQLAQQRAAEVAGQVERLAAIDAVTAWVENVTVPESLLISVVVPTHNRADLVPRALASVQAQTYTNWEILAVDDGSSDVTPEVLARCAEGEPRIKLQRTEGVGVSAARNVGIDAAVGDVLVYLDDDNVFDPMWFKTIVWAFQQRPEVDVLYGARIIDDIRRVMHAGSGSMPYLQFERWSREFLERDNMADIGVIAHRSKLAEARFDPRLDAHADWDFFLNITADRVPLELPAVALYYTSDSANRLSDGDRSDAEIIRARLRADTT